MRALIFLAALLILVGMVVVLYTYRPVRKDDEPQHDDPPFDYTAGIQEKLDLAILAQLSDEERAEVQRYANDVHYDTFHGPNARGIWGCCINPQDPRKVRNQSG